MRLSYVVFLLVALVIGWYLWSYLSRNLASNASSKSPQNFPYTQTSENDFVAAVLSEVDIYLASDQHDQAVESLQTAIGQYPDNKILRARLADLLNPQE